MADLIGMSASRLAALIRTREVSPLEVMRAHLARIEEVNPKLNAVVVPRYEQALEDARQAEERLLNTPRDELPPFFGVPCTIKEMIWVKGMPATIGSLRRREFVAPRNATVVDRVLQAGAIPMGLTNQPEMAFWVETSNLIYGRTNNPHDLSRSAGGSSGGEAAIIGAGGSPFGLGSDGGGSIRMPAFYCGVFGHKPTGGLVPLTGHYPADVESPTPSKRLHYITIGPLTRHAEDLEPLLRLLAGPDGKDPSTYETPGWRDRKVPRNGDWNGRRVYVCADPRFFMSSRTQPEVQEAVHRAAANFKARGAEVIEFDPRMLWRGLSLWGAMFGSAEGDDLHGVIGGDETIRFMPELLNLIRQKPRYTPAVLLMLLAEKFEPKGRRLEKLLREGEELRMRFEALLGPDSLLILPTQPRVAPRHRYSFFRPTDWGYTAIFNVLESPATAIPMGFSNGLPIGVQAVGSRGSDLLTIAAARDLALQSESK